MTKRKVPPKPTVKAPSKTEPPKTHVKGEEIPLPADLEARETANTEPPKSDPLVSDAGPPSYLETEPSPPPTFEHVHTEPMILPPPTNPLPEEPPNVVQTIGRAAKPHARPKRSFEERVSQFRHRQPPAPESKLSAGIGDNLRKKP